MQTEIQKAAREIDLTLENFRAVAQRMAALCDTLSCAFDTETAEFESLFSDSQRFAEIAATAAVADYSGIAAQCKTAH